MNLENRTALIATLILFFIPTAGFGWILNGVPVSTAPGAQTPHTGYSSIVPDGQGGTILLWLDSRDSQTTSTDLYAQRLDRDGNPLWTADGVPVCTAVGTQSSPPIVSDGSGGIIVVWEDNRGGSTDLYAQRIGAAGVPLWTTDGAQITDLPDHELRPVIVSDGSGGAIVAWEDQRYGLNDTDIFAQRIDASGTPLWTANGVPLVGDTSIQEDPVIATDGAGGAFVLWLDQRNANVDIYGNRVTAAGFAVGGSVAWAVADGLGDVSGPVAVADGTGGVICTWQDNRSDPFVYDVYAQRIDATGAKQWNPFDVSVCSDPTQQLGIVAVTDDEGGAIVAWQDFRAAEFEIYAQRLTGDGVALWQNQGTLVSSGASTFGVSGPAIATDGAGGAVLSWLEYQVSSFDILAEHLDPYAQGRWGIVPVMGFPGDEKVPAMVYDGNGGAVVAAGRYTATGDLYAQRIELQHGYWGRPEPQLVSVVDNPNDQGGNVIVSWKASERDALNHQTVPFYSIWRATGTAKAGEASPAVDPAHIGPDFAGPGIALINGYAWEWLANQPAIYASAYSYTAATRQDSVGGNPGLHHFQVIAHTADAYTFFTSNVDSGSSVDNLAPAAVMGLNGAGNFDPEQITLTWQAVFAPDLSHYEVYRGFTPDFPLGPGNLIATISDTTMVDSAWMAGSGLYYKVAATDIHGNLGPAATLSPWSVANVGDELPVARFRLEPNVPNPFNPATVIAFEIGSDSRVDLIVLDVSGKRVRTLLEAEPLTAGRHERTWNGRDDRSRPAAAGVYFYHLQAEDQTLMRKMLLLK